MNLKYYFTYLLVVLSLISTLMILPRLSEGAYLKEAFFFVAILIVSFYGLYLFNKTSNAWVLLFGFFTVALANGYYLTANIGRRSVILNFIMFITLVGLIYSMTQMTKCCPKARHESPKPEIVDIKEEPAKKTARKPAKRTERKGRKAKNSRKKRV